MVKKIHDSVFLLTKPENEYLNSLTYLMIEGDEAVLFEPGSFKDFQVIYQDIQSIINPLKIKYVIMSHPDPDLSASLPLFEKKLGTFSIVTEWRSKEVLDAYRLESPYYLIKDHDYKLTLKSGRLLQFMPTPFAHYSGAFVSYDTSSKILFSGDIFGGMSQKHQVFANDDYLESMDFYHENYMPSSDFLRPIMKELMNYDIDMICPQHGSIIKKSFVEKAILKLYHLEFYNALKPSYDHQTTATSVDFKSRIIQMIIRLKQLFSEEEIANTFTDSPIQIGFDPVEVQTDLNDFQLWHRFFEIIYAKRGNRWLNALESLVSRVTSTYQIPEPQIFQLRARKLQEQNQDISKKYSDLETSLTEMSDEISKTKDQLLRDPITSLYKIEMLKTYISNNIKDMVDHTYLINISIDQIIDINRKYSTQIGDETLALLKYIISNQLSDDELLFRGQGPSLILLKQNTNDQKIKRRTEHFRNMVSKSEQFIQPITISMGIAKVHDQNMIDPKQQANDILSILDNRLEQAKRLSHGSIVFKNEKEDIYYKNNILLVDEEQVNINLITHYFQEASYRVYHAINPFEAMEIIEKQPIDLIISEINLSKLDGFALKKSLNEKPEYAQIPFIFLSHIKNELLIERANRLNVQYFMQKPFFMVELLGLVKRAIS